MLNSVRLHRVTAKKTVIFKGLKYFTVVQRAEQVDVAVTF
jgi:hypothetical protein